MIIICYSVISNLTFCVSLYGAFESREIRSGLSPSHQATCEVMAKHVRIIISKLTCREFYTTFCHYPCTPCSLILEDLYSEPYMIFLHEGTPIVSLFMSRSFPFCTISLETSVLPSLRNGVNGLCLPSADVQRLALLLTPIKAFELCLGHVDPAMEIFLNQSHNFQLQKLCVITQVFLEVV